MDVILRLQMQFGGEWTVAHGEELGSLGEVTLEEADEKINMVRFWTRTSDGAVTGMEFTTDQQRVFGPWGDTSGEENTVEVRNFLGIVYEEEYSPSANCWGVFHDGLLFMSRQTDVKSVAGARNAFLTGLPHFQTAIPLFQMFELSWLSGGQESVQTTAGPVTMIKPLYFHYSIYKPFVSCAKYRKTSHPFLGVRLSCSSVIAPSHLGTRNDHKTSIMTFFLRMCLFLHCTSSALQQCTAPDAKGFH